MFFRRSLPALLWAVLILLVCLMPSSALPGTGIFGDLPIDKLVHAFLFGVFFVLLFKGFKRQTTYPDLKQHAVLSSFIIAVVYGVLTEFLQEVMDLGRRAEVADMLADTVGVFLGMVYLRWGEAWVMRYRERFERYF